MVGEAEVCLLGQDLPVPLLSDLQGDLERYWAWAVEVARMMEGDLEAVEVALQAARACYSMLMRVQDVLHWYQDNYSMFLEWQTTCHILKDLRELRNMGLPLDNNNLALT